MSPCAGDTPPEVLRRTLIDSLNPQGVPGLTYRGRPVDLLDAATLKKAVEEMKSRPSRTAILPDADSDWTRVPEWGKNLIKRFEAQEKRLDLLVEAVSLNHTGHPPEGRSDACWSCKIIETVAGLGVAHRLMGKDDGLGRENGS